MFGKAIGGLANWAGKGKTLFGKMGATGQHALAGAAMGGVAGGFGLNPLSPMPFGGGGFDMGGALGGAAAGAAGGAAFGKWGAGKNLYGRGTARMREGLAGASLYANRFGRAAGYGHTALINTNKYGDKILAGMAATSAGLIGGSVLSTNRSY